MLIEAIRWLFGRSRLGDGGKSATPEMKSEARQIFSKDQVIRVEDIQGLPISDGKIYVLGEIKAEIGSELYLHPDGTPYYGDLVGDDFLRLTFLNPKPDLIQGIVEILNDPNRYTTISSDKRILQSVYKNRHPRSEIKIDLVTGMFYASPTSISTLEGSTLFTYRCLAGWEDPTGLSRLVNRVNSGLPRPTPARIQPDTVNAVPPIDKSEKPKEPKSRNPYVPRPPRDRH